MKRISASLFCFCFFMGTLAFSASAFAATSQKPIELKLAHFVPEGSFLGQQTELWAKAVEKETNGRIKIKRFWMQSLVRQPEMLKALQTGIIDIGYICSTYYPSNFPLYMMVDNVGNCTEDYGAVILSVLDTIDHQPDLKEEFKKENVQMVYPYLSGLAQIGVKNCFDSFFDIKGKTIRTYGSSGTQLIKNLGANPIFMPYSDIYEAVQRGTIRGATIAIVLSNAFKHQEVMKCIYMVNQGAAVGCGMMMRRDAFLKLPPDIQETLLKLSKEYGMQYAQALQDLEKSIYAEWVNKDGVTLKKLTKEESDFVGKAEETSRQEMIKAQEAGGHAAAGKVWDYYITALKKYTKERAK